jgi:hypothetical protein
MPDSFATAYIYIVRTRHQHRIAHERCVKKYCRMLMVAFVEPLCFVVSLFVETTFNWFVEVVVQRWWMLQAQSQHNRGSCSSVWLLQTGCIFAHNM